MVFSSFFLGFLGGFKVGFMLLIAFCLLFVEWWLDFNNAFGLFWCLLPIAREAKKTIM